MISLLLSLSFAFAGPSTEGQEIGNAAGGIINGGKAMTFGSAQVAIQEKALRTDEIPGLLNLTERIMRMPLSADLRKEMMGWIYPTGTLRTYYKIDESHFSLDARKKLIQEYAQMMKVPEDQIVLFAITNRKAETFLLPEFFKLNDIQKQVILLHEGLWNFNMDLPYKDVVETEIAAQNYFQNENNYESYSRFFEALTKTLSLREPHPEILLMSALSYDQINPPEAGSPFMLLWKLLGQDFLNCYRQQKMQNGSDGAICTDELVMSLQGPGFYQSKNKFSESLISLLRQYPQGYYLCLLKQDREHPDFSSSDEYSDWLQNAIVPGIGRRRTMHDPPIGDPEVPLSPAEKKTTRILSAITDGQGKFWGNLALCQKAL